MKQKSGPVKAPAQLLQKGIRRPTLKYYSADDKFRIVLEALRCKGRIADFCGS